MSKKQNYYYPLVIMGVLFFVFGVITWSSAVLIPYFKIGLELSNTEATLVAFATFVSYFLFSIPASGFLNKTGYKKGLIIGLIIMSIGALLFIPAALLRQYNIFLIAIFVMGIGIVLLQTAANPYVTIIGPTESTAQRMGFMGIANRLGGVLTQVIFSSILLKDAGDISNQLSLVSPGEKELILSEYLSKVINPYIFLAILFIVVAILIYFSNIPNLKDEEVNKVTEGSEDKKSILSFPYLVLGVIALLGDGFISVAVNNSIMYGDALGVAFEEVRRYSEFALTATLIGFFANTILIPKFLSQQRALVLCAITGFILTWLSYLTEGRMSAWFFLVQAFFSAFTWGGIWGLAIRNLGKYTKLGSALLLMTLIASGVAPIIFGNIIDMNPGHPQKAVLMLIPVYIYLFYYGKRGYKVENWRKKTSQN